MSTISEADLKELKTLIETQTKELDKKIDVKFDKVSETLNDLRVEIAALKTEVAGNNKRLDNIDFIMRTIFVGVVTAIILGVYKFLFSLFPNT
ncbi:hypothetical protein [Gloeocapsa sp. PCC 73106]|uniref:hypothetical protein n=1 Tax=Gloeocapsa sp. PCC 73106 TaxID=102232 RepID=UPI0002E43DE8|nr:hypothetical protein [Gloeocapsa sp. PCC 73106]